MLGWPEQLRFAFRSLLGYALFRRPITSRVQLRLEHIADRKIRISLSFPSVDDLEMTTSLSRDGQLDAAGQQARENASLALGTVELAVNRHNGNLSKYIDHSTLTFAIELQATELGATGRARELKL